MKDADSLGSARTLARALLFVGLSEASAKVGLVVATLLVARSLGAAEFGRWSFAVSLAGLLGLLSDAGMTSAVQKRLAVGQDDQRRLIGNAIALRCATAMVGYGALVTAALLSGKPSGVVMLLLLLGISSVATQFNLFVGGMFRALACSQLDAVTRIGQQVALLVPVVMIAMMGGSALAYGMAFAAAAGALVVVTLTLLRSRVSAWPRLDWECWRNLAAEAWPFWLSGIMWLAYFRVDVVILSYLSTDHQTGLYNMAYNGFQVLTLPSAMLVASLFPSLAHLHAKNPARFLRLRRRALQTAVLIAVGVACGSGLASDVAIRIVLGDEYGGSVLLFRVLVMALVFVFANSVMYQSLSAADGARFVAAIAACGALVNIALNFMLVPVFDALGAAIATLVTEASLFLLLNLCSWWVFRSRAASAGISSSRLAQRLPA